MIDIDELFAEVMAGKQEEVVKFGASSWVRVRGVALVNRDTNELLGNFTEYRHRTEPGTRWLRREDNPLPAAVIEYMDGEVWGKPPKAQKRAWKVALTATLPLRLANLQLSCAKASVTAQFGEGDLVEVVLAAETIFTGVESSLFIFPAGTKILDELAPASVTALLQQLGQPCCK